MRTLLTFLLLVCFGTTQAAAAECPMAPAPAGQDASAPHHGPHHAGHDAPPPSSDHDHHPLRHAATGCGIAMSCGVSALPAAHAPAPSHGVASAACVAMARFEYASHHPATEPPPPRPPSA